MEISGKTIAQTFYDHLQKEVRKYIGEKDLTPPKLVIFSVDPNAETRSFIRAKKKAAAQIGAEFNLVKFNNSPRFQTFAQQVAEVSQSPKTTSVIIQHPLPPSLSTMSLYDYVPDQKEIEGFKYKVPFDAPIGLAVLTILKKIYSPEAQDTFEALRVDLSKDTPFFKSTFKRKRVVLLGRGKTAGKPIGEILTEAKINHINLNSQTATSEMFIKQADVIVSAVGKEVINPDWVKDGAALISIGIRKDGRSWKGDYNETKIKEKALAYTPTPGGVGPINVAYLLYNLVQSWKIQNGIKSE